MSELHSVRFPGESAAYRSARDELLHAEIALRRQTEAVAALRRTLPLGGAVPEDYAFDEGAKDLADETTVTSVRLSALFPPDMDTLFLYSFMYGPAMKKPCPMCTSFLDGLDGNVRHLTQKAGLAVVAKSPIQRIRTFARERGWRNFRLLSSAATTYNRDYGGETESGSQMPSMNVFVRRDGRIHHFYNTEVLWVPTDPGQGSRHIDPMWPLWNLLDLTPAGRGADWGPALSYPER